MTISSKHKAGKKTDKATEDAAHLRLLKALAHPVRLHLLGVLSHRDRISPAEFARDRSEPVSNVSYHFRELVKLNCIEVVTTKPARGSTEHFYRRVGNVVFDDDSWLEMPNEAREIVAATIVRDFVGRVTHALQEGTFTSRKDVHITWRPVRLDEEGWTELTELLNTVFHAVSDMETKAAERMAVSGDDGLIATVGLAGFESPKDQSK